MRISELAQYLVKVHGVYGDLSIVVDSDPMGNVLFSLHSKHFCIEQGVAVEGAIQRSASSTGSKFLCIGTK